MKKKIVLWVAVVLIAALAVFVVWAENPMRAEATSVEFVDTPDGVVLTPATPNGTGLVFIAGARVEPQAYASKLSGLVDAGFTVVIARPTLNFAIFELRPLETFEALAPGINDWFVGGHSLGGVKACQYAASDDVEGLVLFGSYCGSDISTLDLPVLTVSASNDGLSTPAAIADAADLLPASTTRIVIDGANHAQFGDYGVQPGDGESTVTDDDVRSQLTDALVKFMSG